MAPDQALGALTDSTAYPLLTADLTALVLIAALLHATWNALVKMGGDRLLVLASVNFIGALVGGAVALFVTPPDKASWFYLFLSTVLHNAYYFFLLQSYRVGDLSQVYPLARGTAPLLVLAAGALLAGEQLPAAAIVGIVLACLGIASLTFESGAPWRNDGRPVLLALTTGFWIASYTIVDGMGVRLSHSPLGYIGWLFLIDGWPIALAALYHRRGRVRVYLRSEWKHCVGGGLASVGAYGLVIFAMNTGAMAAVSALRETSVIIATAIGTLVLRERFGWRRILAAFTVTVGVLVMNLA